MTERVTKYFSWNVKTDGTKQYYPATKKYVIKSNIYDDGTIFKLTPEQVAEVKKLRETGISMDKLAVQFECSRTTIKKALNK